MRNNILKLKVELQDAVAGAVMLENCYAEVAHILKPMNFTNTEFLNYEDLWTVIGEMFAEGAPIDICTVTNSIFKKHQRDEGWKISLLCNRIASAANIQYHAFIILQYDLQVKYDLMVCESISKCKESETVAKAALHEVSESLRCADADILNIIRQSIPYFKAIGLRTELIGPLEEFSKSFDSRCEQIRKLPQANHIFGHLNKLMEVSGKDSAVSCFNEIMKMIKLIYNSPDISPQLLNKLIDFNHELETEQV